MSLGDFCPAGAGRSRAHSPMLVAEWSLGGTRPGWEGGRGMHSAGDRRPQTRTYPVAETEAEEAEDRDGGAEPAWREGAGAGASEGSPQTHFQGEARA